VVKKSMIILVVWVISVGSFAEIEISSGVLSDYEKFDQNHDGLMNLTEYTEQIRVQLEKSGKPGYQGAAAERFIVRDFNSDGYISMQEAEQKKISNKGQHSAPPSKNKSKKSKDSKKQGAKKNTSKPSKKKTPKKTPKKTGNQDLPTPQKQKQPPAASITSKMYWQWLDDRKVDSETSDFDNDGLSNLIEYAFGSNPTKSDTDRYLPESSTIEIGGTTRNIYTYRRRRDAKIRGLHYALENGNPTAPHPTERFNELSTSIIDDGFESVTVLVPNGFETQLRIWID